MKVVPFAPAPFAVAAVEVTGGCFAVHASLRLGHSAWWLLPGAVALVFFAWLFTLYPACGAGRVYAACGGVCLVGTEIILFAPRTV